MRHHTIAFALVAAIAVPAAAIEKEDLRHRYPTLEAAAHSFGALDVNHTEDHQLILTASFPPGPGQWSGMITYPEDYKCEETGHIELDHVILHNGRTLANLESAFRPDITVWDDPVAKISRGPLRYRIGTVHENLEVEVFPELRDAFPGKYVWIPAMDEVYESPFDLPRVSYTRVAHRRALLHGNTARFALSDGSRASFRIGVVRHFGDTRRFLVANRGRQALILGEMYPFANPETDHEERHYYGHNFPANRKPEFALFNELSGFEVRDHPLEPADPTIVYGVRIYPRFLHHFDVTHGPVLRAEAINPGSATSPASTSPAPKASASPAASPAPAASVPPVPEGAEAPPPPDASPGPESGSITPIPSASPGDAPPPPEASPSPAASPKK